MVCLDDYDFQHMRLNKSAMEKDERAQRKGSAHVTHCIDLSISRTYRSLLMCRSIPVRAGGGGWSPTFGVWSERNVLGPFHLFSAARNVGQHLRAGRRRVAGTPTRHLHLAGIAGAGDFDEWELFRRSSGTVCPRGSGTVCPDLVAVAVTRVGFCCFVGACREREKKHKPNSSDTWTLGNSGPRPRESRFCLRRRSNTKPRTPPRPEHHNAPAVRAKPTNRLVGGGSWDSRACESTPRGQRTHSVRSHSLAFSSGRKR